MELVWDDPGQKKYETGVDHGVLYIPDGGGAYTDGVAWNGLTQVTEKPSGAEPTPVFADNIKYLNLFSAEQFGATVEAVTYPDEFTPFDGLGTPTPGVLVGQQNRGVFGLSYRTKFGNDLEGEDYGYKLHLVYGCQASPSERAYATVNDTPEAMKFSWEISTTPVPMTGFKPTSILTIVSTDVDPDTLGDLETILYGTEGVDPALPLPDTIVTMFAGGVVAVVPQQPAFNAGTNTITIPAQAGVQYYIDNVLVPAGPVVIAADTLVIARPAAGYVFPAGVDDDWFYDYTAP